MSSNWEEITQNEPGKKSCTFFQKGKFGFLLLVDVIRRIVFILMVSKDGHYISVPNLFFIKIE